MEVSNIIKEYLPLIISLMAVIIAWRKAPSEAKKNEAGAANDYAAAAQRYAELAHDQRTQIDSMEAKQQVMEERLNKAMQKIDELEKELEEVKAWSLELCKQLVDNQIVPVEIEAVRRRIHSDKVMKRKVGANRDT